MAKTFLRAFQGYIYFDLQLCVKLSIEICTIIMLGSNNSRSHNFLYILNKSDKKIPEKLKMKGRMFD